MIIEHKNDLGKFREAVREWTRRMAPPEKAHLWKDTDGLDQVEIQKWWMAERGKVGLATGHWPSEYGGSDLSLAHQIIIADEFARADAPMSDMFVISLNHIPGTLIPFGTEEQKKRHLPAVSRGVIWCQGFSEPGAGSDLASLRTSAVRDGDHYIVNGQKIWSSHASYAEHCMLLTRTSSGARKQDGITYLLMDMNSPGVEVRPIKRSTGAPRFAEIFLTDVRIPVANRLGEEDQGWSVAQATLSSERGVVRFEIFERLRHRIENYFGDAVRTDAAWLGDDELRREFTSCIAALQAARRQTLALLRDRPIPETPRNVAPAIVKLTSSELAQRIFELQTRIAGLGGQVAPLVHDEDHGMYGWLDSYGRTISAGTNEIMRNLIAERGMGMPR
ncbi:MAG TPA: acyl-CoA dehydrogenase family protein [Sphingobium sp.]|nr:acyl-CoA dehydrogenase family protein [Sphingobium sp.]